MPRSIDHKELPHHFDVWYKNQLWLRHCKSSVGGFELLFQLAIDFLQRPNAEAESRHNSFVRETLPLLQIIARSSRRGSTNPNDPVTEGLRPVEPRRRDLRTRSDTAEVDLRFFRLHQEDRCGCTPPFFWQAPIRWQRLSYSAKPRSQRSSLRRFLNFPLRPFRVGEARQNASDSNGVNLEIRAKGLLSPVKEGDAQEYSKLDRRNQVV